MDKVYVVLAPGADEFGNAEIVFGGPDGKILAERYSTMGDMVIQERGVVTRWEDAEGHI